jgi:hypothetical protein
MTDEVPIVRKLYEIKSILKTEPPPGADGSDWYRYEIAHGTNCINGYKQGSLEEVTEAMEENVVLLNERQFGKKAVASKQKVEAKAEEKKEESTENKTDN